MNETNNEYIYKSEITLSKEDLGFLLLNQNLALVKRKCLEKLREQEDQKIHLCIKV